VSKYSLPQSKDSRAVGIVLAVGTVIAVSATLGPVWIVRAGVAVAVLGSFLAVWFAWREVANRRRAHLLEVRTLTRRAAEDAERHHEETMEVIDRFTTRHQALSERLDLTRGELDVAQAQLATLKGSLIATQSESRKRAARIHTLEGVVKQREAELAELADAHAQVVARLAAEHGEESDGDLVAWPRYGAAAKNVLLPSARELWGEGNDPDVIDLAQVAMPAATPLQKHA
jgi:hypothetical protein